MIVFTFNMGDDSGADFKPETVLKFLQLHFKDERTKMSSLSVVLLTEVLRVFVSEASGRAAKQAKDEETNTVTIEHFEKILPHLLLDI